ncbi:acyltransferase [Salidesulfovibrio onnuriiensis]|uniref:acyltransferase n=1 Tax=Salidesulfovibrio onnuriiensis TaxID=2583823 RepID=UPI001C9BE33F|nr:acyltransferase family protein [Salidesulfovibrio onnuriiensis]
MLKPFTNAQTLRKYSVRKKIAYLDLLRCMAAVAVVVIHVLGPYREQINNISNGAWETATTFNTLSRWAVPVFIMITGALMLSDTRKFNIGYFFKRRLRKVLVPFLAWSIFYAWLSGVSPTGYSADIFRETLVNIPTTKPIITLVFSITSSHCISLFPFSAT